MNNIDYKNVVLSLAKNSSLPYKETGHVKYTSNMSLNSSTMNNTFSQFVDNDKFIESYLNGTQSYQYGPKSDDQQKIYYGDDGYKYFKDQGGQLAIYRKIEKDLNDDIGRKIDGNANFIFQREYFYVCGTDSSLRYSKDLDTWSSINLRDVRGYYSTDYVTVVAAKDGVYFVEFDVDQITVDKINETELQECRSVYIVDTDYIYVGCADGIYRAYYGAYSRGNKISFSKLEIRKESGTQTTTHDVQVNDIIQFDDRVYLAAEDNVYIDRTEQTLKGYKLWLEDEHVNCAVRVGDYTFVGTNKNLFAKWDQSDQFYPQFPTNTPVYSGVSCKDTGYFGTISGILSVQLANGILDPVEEYPFISSLTHVTTLKSYKVNGENRVYGIDGVSAFYVTQSTDDVAPVLTAAGPTDIHVSRGKVFVSTSNGLTKAEETKTGYSVSTYLGGRNVRKIYGSAEDLTLVLREGADMRVRTFKPQSTPGELSEPVKYTLNTIDEDGETIVPVDADTFENITFSKDRSVMVATYGDNTYFRTRDRGNLVQDPVGIPYVTGINKTGKIDFCTYGGLAQFDSYGKLFYFCTTYNSLTDTRYNRFVVDDGMLYACSQRGIYKITDDIPVKISQSIHNGEIGSFLVDDYTGKYLIPISCYVYETDNVRRFKTRRFDIDGVDWIKQVFKKDSKNYLFVTDKGLYKTNYQYQISNDIQKFSVQDAIGVYESMKDQIDSYYTTQYNTHMSRYHGEGCTVDLLANSYIDKDFEGVASTWQKGELCADYSTFENDIVYEIESSTNEDGDITASTSNASQTLSGLSIDDIPLSYILKRWKSGNCELYIYLTTTNTYYLPFNRGIPDCDVDETEGIERKNLNGIDTVTSEQRVQNSKISEHYTNISLNILSAFCFMDCIQDIQINGNSLPLRIYKDRDQKVNQTSQSLYQSFIEPSVVDECDISQTDQQGAYNFKFKCFGSDSQAIRIQFSDSMHRYGSDSYTICFDSNGGTGKMKPQRVSSGGQVMLRKNKFTKRVSGQTQVFRGWSLTKQAENTQPTFADQDQFSSETAGVQVENGGTITLYAVWLAYNFDNGNSTQISLISNTREFIIKEAETFTDEQVGSDQVIIDFGE